MSREEVLDAVKEATSITREYVDESQTCFDLIRVTEELDIPVLFRPLDNMWGGAVSIGEKKGILIKSNLPRHLQRFTLAHEIGHIVLGHKNKFDEEVGLSQRATGRSDRPVEEIAADTFASELLAPFTLIKRNAERQDWSRDKLKEPEWIYQLALRLGISFEATCWALVDHDLLDRSKAQQYRDDKNIVKDIKNSFIPNRDSGNSYAHVWSLSQRDAGFTLEADEDDLFLLELEERSSSGYRWETTDNNDKIEIFLNENDMEEGYGSFSSRIIGFRFNSPGVHTLALQHKRPWNNEVIQEVEFSIDNRGREEKGLPRRMKQATLMEATT